MKSLPVPPLAQTLERYLTALGPLQTAHERAVTGAAVTEFANADGPACQEELERFARAEHRRGRSWLTRAWQDTYLEQRSPLPLAGNVAFQLAWDRTRRGVDLAADVAHRLAAVHLRHLRGEARPEVSPRGEPLTPTQWRYLAGGIRDPRPGTDGFLEGHPSPAHREIVVLRHNRAHALAVSDAAGRPLPRPALAAAMTQILRSVATPGTFTDPSLLGSEHAAAVLDRLRAEPAGAETYRRLREALFVLDLGDEGETGGTAEALRRVAFDPGAAWVYKPLSVEVGLVDGFVAVHVEHSILDGATLAAHVAQAHLVQPDDRVVEAPAAGRPTELVWPVDARLRGEIDAALQAYRAEAGRYRVRVVTVPFTAPAGLRFSHDGAMQWIMLVAQRATWGRVRSTYEAVDMREYLAGRTECLRPNTPEAVALAGALLDGDATPEQLEAARGAHSALVKACKSGNGIDRHLFGLRAMASRLGLTPRIFADDGYRLLTTDVLSTTSIGGRGEIVRLAFAPTADGGVGVNYTADPGAYEFCLTWRADEIGEIDAFVSHLRAGARALEEGARRAGPTAP
ncbi:choline/carnitine O-acyltransferase [Pseudactinotalea sp. HY158]|uniref:choline/carnitine O-acyltransferase n=1 Tax=Pseudactinotalea sp. HY158 TaxID=2654547 RepID=UPI00129D0234|nr:choline/carnitine O-acyltransferase [Pseudactinotalea sp. HY158]QGH68980.1 choline/carnitine O-acyltransferase [Pseudactinotalea sp. HY158]